MTMFATCKCINLFPIKSLHLTTFVKDVYFTFILYKIIKLKKEQGGAS